MQPDLIQRSRGGDHDAFAGLVSIWADRALQIALVCTTDSEVAVDAVARALPEVYRALPSLHPEGAFRPWLMRHVMSAAGDKPRDDRLRVLLSMRTRRDVARADAAISSHLSADPRLRLPERFYADRVEPVLSEPTLRSLEGPTDERVTDLSFATLVSAGTTSIATEASVGMQRRLRGSQRSRLASRDTITILRTAPGTAMSWSVRSKVFGLPGSIDAIYEAVTEEAGTLVRLRGLALPIGRLEPIWRRIAADGLDQRVARMGAAFAAGQR